MTSTISISRVLHAGYIFSDGVEKIIFDPIFENPFSRNCFAFPEVQFDLELLRQERWSAVVISHFHDDHCSFESLESIDLETPIFVYCVFDEMFEMLRAFGFRNVHALRLGQKIKFGSIEITPLKALDEDVDSLFHIQVGNLNILNVVDSWIHPETMAILQQVGSWDLVLWPFQMMRELEVLSPSFHSKDKVDFPEEWTEQLKVLHPRYIVPSSCQFIHEPWSWYNQSLFAISYAMFEKYILQILPSTSVMRMNPSVSFQISSQGIMESAPLAWISPIGDQDLDYQFRPELGPQKVAEIAKNFPALNRDQKKQVSDFLEFGLLRRFSDLPIIDDVSYFEGLRNWRLEIFDYLGNSTSFDYIIDETRIELGKNVDISMVDWYTQVSEYKLHSALTDGESLTSIYLRINDWPWSTEKYELLRDVDATYDPLVRCLYSGRFGDYQMNQLKKIGILMDGDHNA